MKNLKSLKKKLESVKKLGTAEKIAKNFKETTELDFNYEFRGVNVYAGHDTIVILENQIEIIIITYNNPILFN